MNLLLKLGQLADERLERLGICLTQGGEPTFVPHDTQAEEWSIAALGPQKLPLARRMALRLITTLYPGAAALCTSGKLYPGEPHPRWALTILHAGARPPLWKDPRKLQWDAPPHPTASPAHAQQLIRQLACSFEIPQSPITAFEDVTEWMRLEESRGRPCPLPRFSRQTQRFVTNPPWTQVDQERWAPYCEPSGWVLPLAWNEDRWTSPRWEWPGQPDFTLLPGNGPLGLRMPLDQVRTSGDKCALTTEIRAGELIVFIPPLPTFEAFSQLLAAIESILARQDDWPPISLEGYLPPPAPGLTLLSLTADPGVLEVNLPPCQRFDALHQLLTEVYSAAHDTGLRGFKRALNGRAVGTGGGAHVLLGGATLPKNPFVLRPSLLPSFLRFTQNHPSLSYLFTGLFVGPSSQATRADESIPGTRAELELALRALESMPAPADPERIDRILRHLLVDWHGNPHRSAICVDKFWYPFSPSGQLGLVEFRAIEMTPHADQLLAIHLLYRALATAFAEQPFREPLLDWGETLHDRFLLPWFLEQDFRLVLSFLRERGFPFEWSPFESLLDFRCPPIAECLHHDTRFAIRQAFEPWPVMGIQPGPTGATSRPVDTSTDRLQILRQSSTQSPSALLLCNDWILPFQPIPHSNALGTALCGLRYRRFNNSLGLQPHIHAHAPLTFDLVEADSGRILESFLYHEQGRVRDKSDLDSEPKDKFGAREFSAMVPLPGRQGQAAKLRPAPPHPSHRFTLDLRQLDR